MTYNNSVASLLMTGGTIGGTGVLTVGSGNADLQTGTVSANLAGPMNLTKTTNGGTVVLSGSNGYSGSTTVSTGVLQLGSVNALPSATALTLSGGTLNLQTYANTVNTFTLSGGTLTGSGAGALNIGTSANLQTGVLNAPLGGGRERDEVQRQHHYPVPGQHLRRRDNPGCRQTGPDERVRVGPGHRQPGAQRRHPGQRFRATSGFMTGNVTGTTTAAYYISPGSNHRLRPADHRHRDERRIDPDEFRLPGLLEHHRKHRPERTWTRSRSWAAVNFSGGGAAQVILPSSGLTTGVTYKLIDAAAAAARQCLEFRRRRREPAWGICIH